MNTELNKLSSLERVLKLDQLDLSRCERKGIELAKLNSPSSDEQKLTSFELEEKNKIETALLKFLNEVNSLIKKLEQKKTDIIRKLDVHIPKMQSMNEEKHQEDLEKFQKVLGEKSNSFKEIKGKYVDAQNELKNIKVSVNNRPLDVKLVEYYIPFMAVLAVSEVYINRFAFELFFRSSPIISILLASAIGAVLIFFAHITGESVKKAQSKEVELNKSKTYLTLFFLNLFVLVLIFFLAVMRENFLAIIDAEGTDIVGELESLIGDAIDETPGLSDVATSKGILETLFSFSIGQHGFFLVLLNIAIYLSGTFAAFMRHDSHPTYEIAEKKYNQFRQEFFKVQKEFDQKISEIDQVQSQKYKQIAQQRDEIEEELYQIDKDISDYQSLTSDNIKKANAVLKERINAFREANKKNRTTNVPKYFKEVIKVYV